MKKYQMLIGVIVIAMVVISITIYAGMKNTGNVMENTQIITNQSQNTSELPTVTASSITLEQLAEHNTQESCWIIYKDKVYDLTDWLQRHPGGVNSIAKHCGTEGFENAFIKKHGTSKSDLFMKVAIYMGDLEELGNIQ